MAAGAPVDLPVVEPTGPLCRHFRHNGMYVFTDGPDNGDTQVDCDTSMHWCLSTMKGYGPDDELVGRHDCSLTSRSCYRPT